MADDDGEDEAARAFEGLRAEVSLMRRAVERLSAERADDSHAPDYSETLGVIAANITATAQGFATTTNTGVTVSVNTTTALDIKLAPGAINETVTVDASGWQVVTPSKDPKTVANEALNELIAKLT